MKRRVLIVFVGVIAAMESNKKLTPVVTELFLRGRKLNVSFFYITILFQSVYNFIMKTSNKRKLQQIASNHYSDTDFKEIS